MDHRSKRPCDESAALIPESSGIQSLLDGIPLPETIILNEILPKVELESLCSLACVSRALRSLVYQALSFLTSLDLSAFSPNDEILGHIAPRLRGVKNVTIDCLRLDDSSVVNILEPHIRELNLLKCSSLSYNAISSIGEKCPDLRVLFLELSGDSSPEIFEEHLAGTLKKLMLLECLSIKARRTAVEAYDIGYIDIFLPTTLKCLKLQPVNERDAIHFINGLRDKPEIPKSSFLAAASLGFGGFKLLHLSLVLDVISDRLIESISRSLPHLVELDLEDRPCAEPKLPNDLTNNGLQCLGACNRLTSLSIVRSRVKCIVPFRRINDLGLLLLSESCVGLESIRLGGFSTVTDAGFSSLLRSCTNLKKFEVRNAPFLSDLAFHDIVGAACPLVELKLQSCNLITSEALAALSSSSTLAMLDTYGCRSIANRCLDYVSCLRTLTSLNLGGADITDSGITVLTKADLPIISLRLRGCTRVTDRGIILLFSNGSRMKKTLSTLDVGHMPGISDRAIHAIISNAESISELCIRYCFHVTGQSFRTLASGSCEGSNALRMLRRLDICHCIRFSARMPEFLQKNILRGLRWLGVGSTSLAYKRDDFAAVSRMQPWLTVCFEGCEFGCHDGWQFHTM